jgi:hypothetical protein
MTSAIVLSPDTARIVASASVTGSFAAVGAALTRPARIVRIVNLTDQPIYWSVDGANPAGAVDKASSVTLDLCANQALGAGAFFAAGTIFSVRAPFATPSAGSAVVIEVYGGRP